MKRLLTYKYTWLIDIACLLFIRTKYMYEQTDLKQILDGTILKAYIYKTVKNEKETNPFHTILSSNKGLGMLTISCL